MTTKIAFIDIDGPMIPVRAFKLPGQTSLYSVFDPCATSLLLDLLKKSNAKIVVCSSWRKSGRAACAELFETNGINPSYFHSDWCTGSRSDNLRCEEINDWLKAHPEVTHYVVLEDESMPYDVLLNAVQCDTYDGFSFRNYQEAKLMLDIPMDDKERSQTQAIIEWLQRKEILRTKRDGEPNADLAQIAADLVFPRIPPNKDE